MNFPLVLPNTIEEADVTNFLNALIEIFGDTIEYVRLVIKDVVFNDIPNTREEIKNAILALEKDPEPIDHTRMSNRIVNVDTKVGASSTGEDLVWEKAEETLKMNLW